MNLASSAALSGPCCWPSRDKYHSMREAGAGMDMYAERYALKCIILL